MAVAQHSSSVERHDPEVPVQVSGLGAPGAEAEITRRIMLVVFVTVPVFVAFWVGVVALAVTFTNAGYEAPLAMAAGVGVLAGIFWASWFGFVAFSHREEAERRSQRPRRPAGA